MDQYGQINMHGHKIVAAGAGTNANDLVIKSQLDAIVGVTDGDKGDVTVSSSGTIWNLSIGTPAQGALLYYNGSAWDVLAAGTSGQFLKTNGAGANPSWATGGFTVGTSSATSGTAGSILFVATGPIVQQNNSNLFWDNSNNRLGLGTTSPTDRLTVRFSGNSLFRTTNTAASSSSQGAGWTACHDDGAALASGDRLGFLLFAGSTTSGGTVNNSAGFNVIATELWTTTSAPARIDVGVCTSGSLSRTTVTSFQPTSITFHHGTNTGSFDLAVGGDTNRTFSMERTTSASGKTLTIQSGGGQSGSSNRNSGDLNLQCGTATGNGSGNVVVKTVAANQGSGTTDRTPATIATFDGKGLVLAGRLRINRTTVADVAYSMVEGDAVIEYTTLTAGRIVTLIAAATAGAGYVLIVKDGAGTANTNNITVDGNGAETIDGAANAVINTAYGVLRLYCTGTAWRVM